MPKLPTYSAGGGEYPAFGGRRAGAEDFSTAGAGLVQAGRAVQGAATSLMSEFEDQEARKALVGSTAIRAKYNKRLDDAALSGEDTDKIKEEMLNELGAIGSDFQTKRGAQNLDMYTAGAEITFDNEASRMKVEKAAAEAKVQGTQFLNSAGANVQRDPTRLKQEEAAAEAFAETFRGKIPAAKLKLLSEGLKQDLNMAAYTAMARVDPAGTKAKLEAGDGNLSPEQRSTGIRMAEHYDNVKRAAEDREKARVKEEQHERAISARANYTQQILDGNLSRALEQQIIRDPAFATRPEYMEHLVTFMRADAKRRAGEEKQSDPVTKRDLYQRIVAPEGTPDKIYTADPLYAALKDGKLSTTDHAQLNSYLSSGKNEDGVKFSSRLGQSLRRLETALREDPRTKAMQASEVATVQNVIAADAERRARDLREGKDGKARSADGMFDPKSPDFYFTPALLNDAIKAVKGQSLDAAKAPSRVNTQAEYDALPDGAPYVDSEGKVGVKKAKGKQNASGRIGG